MYSSIKYLFSNNYTTNFLLNNYIFICIPVINPDGVQIGNFRFNALNQNLNRYYKDTSKKFQPEIYLIKNLLKQLNKIINIFFYCDYHSHGSLKDFFIYGNNMNYYENIESKTFCKILSLYDSNFKYEDCIFSKKQMNIKDKNDKYSKQGCSRVYIYNKYKIFFSFTLEIGYYIKNNINFKLSIDDYYKIGINFLKSVYHFSKSNYNLNFQQYSNINQIRLEISNNKENKKNNFKVENLYSKLYSRFINKKKIKAKTEVTEINKISKTYYKITNNRKSVIFKSISSKINLNQCIPKKQIINNPYKLPLEENIVLNKNKKSNKIVKNSLISNIQLNEFNSTINAVIKPLSPIKSNIIDFKFNGNICKKYIFEKRYNSQNKINIKDKILSKLRNYQDIKKEKNYKYLIENWKSEKISVNFIKPKNIKKNWIQSKNMKKNWIKPKKITKIQNYVKYLKKYNNLFLPNIKN